MRSRLLAGLMLAVALAFAPAARGDDPKLVTKIAFGSCVDQDKPVPIFDTMAATKPDVLLLATGSEVSLCTDAYEKLKADGVKARVVSMPSWELFEHQPPEYRDSVLPPTVTARVAVEQAAMFGWHQYVGTSGQILGMKTFGASAPLKELQKKFGFTPDKIVEAAKKQLRR